MEVRHVLEDSKVHQTAVALFVNQSPISPVLPDSSSHQHWVRDTLGINGKIIVGP